MQDLLDKRSVLACSLMVAKLHRLLTLLASVAVFCTPVFVGKVVCTTNAGHYAIEIAHDVTGCPETATDHAPTGEPEPCEDRDLVGDFVSQSLKASCASIDTAWLTLSLIPSPLAVPDCVPSPSTGFTARSSLFPPADHGRLATVVLLI